jgi:hypothetical protein
MPSFDPVIDSALTFVDFLDINAMALNSPGNCLMQCIMCVFIVVDHLV